MADGTWMVYAKKADFKALGARYGIDQVTARVLINRDVPEEEIGAYLSPSRADLHDPRLLKDSDKAVSLLKAAIEKNEKIRIIGDYDIDGIFSTYILHQALLRCGASADFAIPHRITDGYGINPDMVEKAAADGVKCIITCDNGIAAADAVALAKERGLTVIVTDHHEIPRTGLPPADAVVNPHREDCAYPFKEICGAVVAWKLVFLLYEAFSVSPEEAYGFLWCAAFATVGDVMPLKKENRTIVSLGLSQIGTIENPGLLALIERTGLQKNAISAYHVGFVLGPCFNASGRLDTAALSIGLLEETDPERAVVRAAELQSLNEERKAMTKEGDERAFSLLEDTGKASDPVLIVYVPGLHESLCGIVAGHVRERYEKPSFVLTDAEDGGLKGSGRSIPAYPMFTRLQACDRFLTKYGGHPMAAGLSLPKENLEDFCRAMIETAALSEEDFIRRVMIDVPMPVSYITEPLVRELSRLEPFGNGNEKPLFADKEVEVIRLSRIGKNKQFLRLTLLLPGGLTMAGLLFHDCEALEQKIADAHGEAALRALLNGQRAGVFLQFTYEPQINEYRGDTSLQVVLKDVRVKG